MTADLDEAQSLLLELVALQEDMEALNSAWLAMDRPGSSNAGGWKCIADRLGKDMQQVAGYRALLKRARSDTNPFRHTITNTKSTMKRVQSRITLLTMQRMETEN